VTKAKHKASILPAALNDRDADSSALRKNYQNLRQRE